MADPTGISEGIQTAIGLGETVAGFINKGKAKKEAAELERTRPKYQIQKEFGQNVDLASSELSSGMSADAKRAYENATVGSESNSLSTILKGGGGGANSVGAIYGAAEGGRENLAIIRDNLRQNQIQNLIAQHQAMAQEEQTQWQVNDLDPWKDKAAANAEARKGAEEQIWGGLNTIAGAGMQTSQQKGEQKQYGLTGNTSTTSTDDVPRIPSYSRTPVDTIPLAKPAPDGGLKPSVYNPSNDIYFPFSQRNSISNLE